MKYDVPLNQLIKIINPFEKKLFSDINEPFSKKLIEKLIKSGDIFPDKNDSIKEIHMKKIAYEYSNYEEKLINVNLNLEYPITDKAHYFVASILKDETKVYCEIYGDVNIIQKMKAVEIDKEIASTNDPEIFNWEVTHISSDKTWDNPEYVLSQIKMVDRDYSYSEFVKPYIAPELWDNKEFILDVIKQSVHYLPYELENSEMLFDIIKDDMQAFDIVWKDSYSSNLLKLSFKDKIQNEIFNDPVKCRFLTENEKDGTRYYEHFSEKVKMDKEVITQLFLKTINNGVWSKPNVFKLLPEVYFQDVKNILDLFNRIELKSLNESDIKKHHYEAWITDKEKIKFLFNNDINMYISHFFKFLPLNLKKDPEIVNLFLSKNPDAIYSLFKKEQKTPLMIQEYINLKGNPELLGNEVFQLKDKKLIKYIVSKNSHILSSKECPSEWLNDDSILIHASEKIHKIGLTKTIINNFVKKEENRDYLKSVNAAVYSKLSANLKNDKEWALKYLRLLKEEHFKFSMMNNEDGLDIKEVPKEIWNNKSFCLDAIKVNKLCMSMIPPQFFFEKDFSLNFFDLIDNNLISKDCLSTVPAEVKKVLDALSINSDYQHKVSNFILNNSLHHNLEDKSTKIKKAKI